MKKKPTFKEIGIENEPIVTQNAIKELKRYDWPGNFRELEIYPWWWRTQEREDLASRAEEMLTWMESSNNS